MQRGRCVAHHLTGQPGHRGKTVDQIVQLGMKRTPHAVPSIPRHRLCGQPATGKLTPFRMPAPGHKPLPRLPPFPNPGQ
jgi:hypothetical protein